MNFSRFDFNANHTLHCIYDLIAVIISPILFIWAVNTLFTTQIPFTFKTWLAGFVVILLIRYHLKSPESAYNYYDDDDEFEEFEFDRFDDDEREDRKAKMKAKLIVYPKRNNKETPPPKET